MTVPRLASRIGRNRRGIAAMLLLTLRGTPTIYYGEEIGMLQVALPPIGCGIRFRRACLRSMSVAMAAAHPCNGTRAPMLVSPKRNRGCRSAKPIGTRTWRRQRRDNASLYNLYRRLIALRRSRRALVSGSYRPLEAGGDLLLFVRQHDGDERLLVALNLGREPLVAAISVGKPAGSIVFSCGADREGERVTGGINLRANEGVVIELAGGELP